MTARMFLPRRVLAASPTRPAAFTVGALAAAGDCGAGSGAPIDICLRGSHRAERLCRRWRRRHGRRSIIEFGVGFRGQRFLLRLRQVEGSLVHCREPWVMILVAC